MLAGTSTFPYSLLLGDGALSAWKNKAGGYNRLSCPVDSGDGRKKAYVCCNGAEKGCTAAFERKEEDET